MHDLRVQIAPLDLVALDLGVGALVVEDAPPGADSAAEAGGQLGELALLAFVGTDLVDRPVQHLRGEHAVGLEVLVAGAVVVAMNCQLALVAGDPRQDAALDHAEVAGEQQMPGLGAQHAARDVGDHGQRTAELRDVGAIVADHRVDHRQRDAQLVALEVVQHRPRRGPSAGGGAVHGEGAAQAVVGVVGVVQYLRELPHARARAVAAQLEQLLGHLVGIVRQHGRDRALAQRLHLVAAGVDRRAQSLHLVDAGDGAVGQLGQPDVDGVALAGGEVAGGGDEGAIDAHAAAVDLGVEELQAALGLVEMPQSGMRPHRARGDRRRSRSAGARVRA